METTEFNFSLGNTESIELEAALAEHLGSTDEIQKKEPENNNSSLPKPKTKEEPKEEEPQLISDTELEQDLLKTAFEEKKEEPKEEIQEEPDEIEIIVQDYKRLGLLDEEAGEIKSHEELLEALEVQTDKKADVKITNFIRSKGQKVVEWFEACVINGVDPADYFAYDKNTESVSGLDMEDVNVQRNLVRRLLVEHSNFTPEKAERYIKAAEADGDLDKEAISAQEQLVAYEEKELAKKIAQKEKEEKYKKQEYDNYVANVHTEVSKHLKSKEINGIPLTDKVAQEVYEDMTVKRWKLPNGDEISDLDKFLLELRQPENINFALQIALLKKMDFDLTKVKQKAISEEKTKFFTKHAKKEKEVSRTTFDNFKIEI